jgi:hypothetical protein
MTSHARPTILPTAHDHTSARNVQTESFVIHPHTNGTGGGEVHPGAVGGGGVGHPPLLRYGGKGKVDDPVT